MIDAKEFHLEEKYPSFLRGMHECHIDMINDPSGMIESGEWLAMVAHGGVCVAAWVQDGAVLMATDSDMVDTLSLEDLNAACAGIDFEKLPSGTAIMFEVVGNSIGFDVVKSNPPVAIGFSLYSIGECRRLSFDEMSCAAVNIGMRVASVRFTGDAGCYLLPDDFVRMAMHQLPDDASGAMEQIGLIIRLKEIDFSFFVGNVLMGF